MFENILGNSEAKAYLEKALLEERLPQSLLFFGIRGIGKTLFAQEMAAKLLETPREVLAKGNHPDFFLVAPEGKSALFSIDQIRKMRDSVYQAPFQAKKKVFILKHVERMQPASANALLKTLEEPSLDTYIFCTTSRPQEILPTILSRLSKVTFHPLPEEEVALFLEQRGLERKWAKLSGGSLAKALELSREKPLEMLVFSLLREQLPFHERAHLLEKLEAHLSKEDPLEKNREIEEIFSLALLWVRDQHLRNMGGENRLLFPEEEKVLFPIPSLEEMEKRGEIARRALELNLPFISIALQFFGF